MAWTLDSTCLEVRIVVLDKVQIIDLLPATVGMLVFYPPYFFFRVGPRLGKLGFCIVGIVYSLWNKFHFVIDFTNWIMLSTSTSLPKNFYTKAKRQIC